MKSLKKALMLIIVAAMLLYMIPAFASSGSTVYVRKHISILYDNSASMRLPLQNDAPNLKWCYASYAAQAFTGLLNDSDTLDITMMNGSPLHGIDLLNDRQASVDSVLNATSTAAGHTPIVSIDQARRVLSGHGLKEGSGTNDPGEQYWLVLMTDGVFTDASNNDCSVEQIANELNSLMTEYPDMRLVYFGIGTENDETSNKAIDFRRGSGTDRRLLDMLHAHANFNAVYSETQESIVQTMQELSNLIAGRYSVSDSCSFNGNEVTLRISRESSAIRNMAILAQNTNARLVSVNSSEQSDIRLKRDVQIRYPYNPKYHNLPEDSTGGYVALVACDNGERLPSGDITLVFSEPVSPGDFSLMYEPAVHINLLIERQNEAGEWVALENYRDPAVGDRIRISYSVCEDGTERVYNLGEMFGDAEESIRFNGSPIEPGETIVVDEGDASIEIDIVMMDGSYRLSTARIIHIAAPSAEDYYYRSGGPIEIVRSDAAENTDKFIDFSVRYNDIVPDDEFMNKLRITAEGANGAKLAGETALIGDGVIRFTPRDPECRSGEYTISLLHEKTVVCTEKCTILPNETYYSAESGGALSITNNHLADNNEYLYFIVTAHTDEGDRPITAEESNLFRIVFENDSDRMNGQTGYLDGGRITFTPRDASVLPGDYPLALYKDDQLLAKSSISIINYNAHYTVEVVVSEPNTVNRFALHENEANVAFIVYEDGVACPSAQLEAMLGNQISVSAAPNSPFLKLETEIAEVNGRAAVVCTPKSSTNSGFVRFFRHIITAINPAGLSADKLNIDIKVDMLHGAEARGELDLVGSGVSYVILVLALLGALVLFGVWFYAWGRAIRFKKGYIFACDCTWRKDLSDYSVALVRGKPVAVGTDFVFKNIPLSDILFKFLPVDEKKNWGGLSFTKGDSVPDKKWRGRVIPCASIKGTTEDINRQFKITVSTVFDSNGVSVQDHLIKIARKSLQTLSESAFNAIIDSSIGVVQNESEQVTTHYVRLESDVILTQILSGNSSYRLWWFVPKKPKRKKKK